MNLCEDEPQYEYKSGLLSTDHGIDLVLHFRGKMRLGWQATDHGIGLILYFRGKIRIG